MLSEMSRGTFVDRLASLGSTADSPGTSRTSSNVSPMRMSMPVALLACEFEWRAYATRFQEWLRPANGFSLVRRRFRPCRHAFGIGEFAADFKEQFHVLDSSAVIDAGIRLVRRPVIASQDRKSVV